MFLSDCPLLTHHMDSPLTEAPTRGAGTAPHPAATEGGRGGRTAPAGGSGGKGGGNQGDIIMTSLLHVSRLLST